MGERIDTVFIGGGTPSLMECSQIDDLCGFIHKSFDVSSDAEFTVEANPQSLTADKLKAFADGGVNRISLGAQSLSDSVLKNIGRCHTLRELEDAVDNIKAVGFKNFNLDLIFALPEQSLEMWRKTLEQAVTYGSTHISCYSLIIDPETPMGKAYEQGKLDLPDEETERLMYKAVSEILARNGIYQYEISNYAKKGYECKHNIGYWECREYIGLGCAAHSYYRGKRYNNTADLEEYIAQKSIVRNEEVLTLKDMQEEYLMLGLRMNKGISISSFNQKFQRDFCVQFSQKLERLKKSGLIIVSDDRVRLTERGLDLCDSVVLEFMSEIV